VAPAPPPSAPPGPQAAVGPARVKLGDDGAEAAGQDEVITVGPVTVGVTPRNIADSVEEKLQDSGSSLARPGGDR
jgi:hypothetical protein